MTYWSFEVPIPHLEDFDDLQDFHFSLSILYGNPAYMTYMTRKANQGVKKIWLDNSYNETMEADEIGRMVDIASQLKVDRVIAPDSPKWPTSKIKEMYDRATWELSEQEIICVISSSEMYNTIRPKRAAVSYWTRPNIPASDLSFLASLNVHFLGLLSIDEIQTYKPVSCDTSMPIKLALLGKTITQWTKEGSPHIHTKDLGLHGNDFFNRKMTKVELKLARYNTWYLKTCTRS